MDHFKFTELIMQMDENINELCDELYAAKQEKPAQNVLDDLLLRAVEQVEDYNNLLKETSIEGRKSSILNYEHDIKFIIEHVQELKK